MARVNIEDSIYKDLRFIRLAMALGGDVDRALGALVRAWSLAQEWYLKTPDRAIPRAEWEAKEINNALIDVGLAIQEGDRIKVRGADTQFAWLTQKSEAGKQGGKTKGKSGKRPQTDVNARKRAQTSSSSSSSFSSSPSSSDSLYLFSKGAPAVADHAADNPEIKSPVGFFIANYVNAFQARYGTGARPNLAGKVQGQIKTFLKDTPLERACNLVQKYCLMEDQWFLTKGHDFGTFTENLTKVGLALDTGVTTSRRKTKAEEISAYNADMDGKILRGEV